MSLLVDGVTVRFGSTVAVDAASFTLDTGSVLGLVGPSGCGKSSLLRAIAGLVPLTDGRIVIDGEDQSQTPTERRDVGFMFQDHALFLHRSVAENVAFGLRMRGWSRRDQAARVEELLELVGLAGFGDRSVERLSGGEAQRVALARALAPSPRLLLLDEPLASLDRARRDELNDELIALLGGLDQTAVYVTHDQHEAFAIADHVGVMRAGRIARIGTPSDVWRDPQTEFVARFVGHEPIIEHDGRPVAVRADAISVHETDAPDPGVGYTGVVTLCAFGGDRFRVSVDVDGLIWKAWSERAWPIGKAVRVQLDPTRLAPLIG